MDLNRAFSYPFADPDWIRKIVITALISLIPILGQLYLFGWTVEIIRGILRGEPRPLPDDIDFIKYLVDGLKYFVLTFVYSLPMILIFLPVFAWLVPAQATSGSGGGSNAAAVVAIILSFCCAGLLVLYGLFITFVLPAAIANWVASNRLGAGFHFGEIFNLVKAAPGAYLMVFLGALLVGLIVWLGSFVLIVGALLAAAYGQAVLAALYAQAFQEARRNRGSAQIYAQS